MMAHYHQQQQRGAAVAAWLLPLLLALSYLTRSSAADTTTTTTTTPRNHPMPDKACEPPHDHYPFCDTTLGLDVRLDDLIHRLTLTEKPYLLTARESPKGNISRLGIPEYDWGGNCMHGVESRCAPDGRCPTSFPNPNTLGPTFNTSLWKTMGSMIGLEARALWLQNVGEYHTKGNNLPHFGLDCWSPNLNFVRDPRWGRNMETPSEDPFVCGQYGTMYTLGMQNNSNVDDRYLQVVATLKHFDANSLEGPHWTPEGHWNPTNGTVSRNSVNAKISLYDLASSYLPAFQAAVVDGQAAGIMCSYNRINGIPVCAHEYLLQHVLRRDWKFRGYVSSDSGALSDFVHPHKYAKDWPETVQLALQAGCDVESHHWTNNEPWATGSHYIDEIPNGVASGQVDVALVDRAVRNALEIRFRLGLFDPIQDQPFWKIPPDVVQAPEHVQLAVEATAQGLVLLKNDNNVLPIEFESSIALIGPHINDQITMAGNYVGQLCPDDDKDCVLSFYGGFFNAMSFNGGELLAAQGCNVTGTNTSGFAEAMDAASKADVVVFIGGLDLQLEKESRDRPDIRLPHIQTQLLKELAKVNSKIILVLMHGGMVGLDAVIDDVPAVVSAGYPGRYAGAVLPDVLFGFNEKAWGKLAVTWYHDTITEELNMVDFSMSRSPGRTHRYYTGSPQYPFGHGLNPLTKFGLDDLKPQEVQSNKSIRVELNVTNLGDRAGDEVLFAFFLPPSDLPASEPSSKLLQQLFGFERIHLQPKESRMVAFDVTVDKLMLHDSFGAPTLFSGQYEVRVTNGDDIASISIEVNEQKSLQAIFGSKTMVE